MCIVPRGKIARSDSRERRLEKERKHVEQKDIVAIKICSKFSVIDMEKNHCYIVYRYNPIGEFIFRIDILL